MDEERKQKLEELKAASPLEMAKLLQELELYDAKSSQEIIDEVYEQFASSENMKDEVLKPVFLSVVDGLLEATAGGRAARKKGLTASRVLTECENFTYDDKNFGTSVNGYTEYKNARENEHANANMTQEYERKNYEDADLMDSYKTQKVENANGAKNLEDEYTGQRNITAYQANPDNRRNDPTHRYQGQTDHIVPLKQIHERFKSNYALDDSDIKRISNIDDNLALTSAEINQVKKEMSNKEYIEFMDEHGNPVDEKTKENMLKLQRDAEKSIDRAANSAVVHNLLGKVDEKAINQKYENLVNAKIAKKKRQYEEKYGVKPSVEEIKKIEKAARDSANAKRDAEIAESKKNQKSKGKEVRDRAVKDATKQAKDYAVGNLILFIVKPIYFELGDIFKHGLREGVNADSGIDAIKIRFGRIKKYVLTNAKAFLGDNAWDFVKGFISSLVEGIISLFVGVFKQILKVIKEGIKIFIQSAKILFGKEAGNMSAAEKGDAIIKLIGGSVIAIAGIGVEALINKIGIGEPWSIVLATMLSGIASALFMYLLDKADIFSVKAEKRRNRIIEIFDERINDINEASAQLDEYAIERLKNQREEFENIKDAIGEGFAGNSLDKINSGLYKMAKFMGVDVEYSNTEEFCEYMDSAPVIQL